MSFQEQCKLSVQLNKVYTSGEVKSGANVHILGKVEVTLACSKCNLRETTEIYSGREITLEEVRQPLGLAGKELENPISALAENLRIAKMRVKLKYCQVRHV